ncbi:MAG: bifunctional glutamate N-acetyltransferase/amino-acid acetyltransferase ArgJ [Kiritimatiellae bacterium]|nr:bifunctional glutamate N-acetyltransferase/amino-acid acetyltransferase ArgJ [Kiritimatiellia bacterium]
MVLIKRIKGGVCSAKGFRAAGVAAGIKYKDRADVALLVADAPCAAAAVFTTNKVAAAPVMYDRKVVKAGRIQAIVANSGCANACTGERGMLDAERTAEAVAETLGIDPKLVLVASTGVIGHPLPMDRLISGIGAANKALGKSSEHGLAAAKAIMTTDTKPKQAAVTTTIDGKKVTVAGMCKGSGMIEPNLATMLGFITTDAAVSPAMLRRALALAVAKSFNRLVVDGDESTNDSVFLLASGEAKNAPITHGGASFEALRAALEDVCISLTRQMAADGEGATKFVTVTVKGAKSEKDAARAARAIAKSPLAKTSWFGRDPNWGRVLAAVGYSGSEVSDSLAEVFYDRVWAYKKGKVADAKQLAKLAKVLEKPSFEVIVDLHLGSGESSIYTCDFSLDYVHINADYTT